MNKKRIILIASILLVIISLSTFSYASFFKNTTQVNENVISTLNCLSISLTDEGGGVNIVGGIPISDADGLEGAPYTFSVTNNCNKNVQIDITLETLSTSTLPINHVKANLKNIELNNTSLISNLASSQSTISGATSKILGSSYLTASPSEGSTKEFNLRLWIDENTTWDEAHNGSTALNYTGKIVVKASPLAKEYPDWWLNPKSNLI